MQKLYNHFRIILPFFLDFFSTILFLFIGILIGFSCRDIYLTMFEFGLLIASAFFLGLAISFILLFIMTYFSSSAMKKMIEANKHLFKK